MGNDQHHHKELHRLRDAVFVSLARDNQTAKVYANWGDDAATVSSSFVLPEPTAEKDFDAGFYRELVDSCFSLSWA
jgi:hypothetical protein